MIDLTLGRSLRLAAENYPDRIAARCDGESVTHRELDRAGNRIAHALLQLGFERGDRVGIILPNGIQYLAIVYAVAKTGITAIFLNYRFTGREIAYQLRDSAARAVIYGAEFADVVREAKREVPDVLTIGADTVTDGDVGSLSDISNCPDTDPGVEVLENDIFYLGYTSGTTGFPKGAIVTHRNRSLAYRYWAIEYKFGSDDRYLHPGPFHHSVQLGFTLAQLSQGGTVSILSKFDAENALRVMHEDRITWSFMVPFMYNAILALPQNVRDGFDLSALRTFISAASPLPTAVKDGLLDAFPSVGLNEFYGATEAGVVTNLKPCDQRRKIRCVGKPILDMEIRIVDDDGAELPAGTVGHLFMKGPTLFDGYYGAADKTASAFRDGWCTLGDLARKDEEGYLYIVDRVKDVIKSGGVNIFPSEIEEVLALHPAVFEVSVVGIPDATWGEAAHAIVVPKVDASLSGDELLAYCRGLLAGYKIPKSLEFRADLPRNPGGKVLKRVLRDEFWKDHTVRV